MRRLFVPWVYVQPNRTTWNWGPFDAAYAQQLAAGLRPLLVAVAAPCWAALNGWCSAAGEAPPAPRFDNDWSRYVGLLASRYPQAIGIEIWNEPNLSALFEPRADPARYTTLLHEAYTAIKSVRPTMPVISGGLFNSPGVGNVVSGPVGTGDQTFLSSMYASGAKAYMDGIGAHPYPWTATPTWDTAAAASSIDRLRAARNAAGDSSKPIWVTEAGESTATDVNGLVGVTPAQQASDVTQLVRYFGAQPDIPVALVDRLVDASPSQGIEAGFGVYTQGLEPKPVACALSALWHGTLQCPAATAAASSAAASAAPLASTSGAVPLASGIPAFALPAIAAPPGR